MNIFVTFASTGFEDTRDKIINEAEATGLFSALYSYCEKDLTPELLSSDTFNVKTGFGLYSWKPDIIWQTLLKANDNDVVVYLDAGCTINVCKEWDKILNHTKKKDIIAFNIHQRNYKWTRRSVFDHFSTLIPFHWDDLYQFGANALIVKKTDIGVRFITEWRDYMVTRLDLCGDIDENKRNEEDARFIQNRYDQTIMTALLYKYFPTGKVKAIWEHFEGKDIIRKQAFIASRRRKGRNETRAYSMKHKFARVVRSYFIYPFCGNFVFWINRCKK